MHRELLDLLNDKMLKDGNLGFIVERLDGNIVFQYNADALLIPASNMKILTGLAGLLYLSPDFKFKTKFLIEKSDNGRIPNMYVIGSGDPTIVDRETLTIWKELSICYGSENVIDSSLFNGIKGALSDIIIDDYLFDDESYNRTWDLSDITQPYAAQVSAFTMNRNTTLLKIRSDDATVSIEEIPNVGYLRIFNELKISDKEDIKVERKINTNDIYLRGTILPNTLKYYNITVHDPTLYGGHILKYIIYKSGILVHGKIRRDHSPKQISDMIVKSIESQALSVIIRDMMKFSINLYADNIAKLVSAKLFNDGSWGSWERVVHRMLKELKIPFNNIIIADASGLSRKNRLSPKLIVEVLRKIHTELPENVRDSFINSLPISGIDGTLKKRMKNTLAEGRVKAKTGTLRDVSSLSGYVKTLNNETLIFSFIANNITSPEKVKILEDQIANVLVKIDTLYSYI
jgi:D-alanyl-D-alanine carboxypeptidase/D-alanyl-D-alanine-endopeptidase (penicillin-binding protein 4)